MGVGVGCYALEVSQYLPVPGVVWFEFIKAILWYCTWYWYKPGTGTSVLYTTSTTVVLLVE